MSFVDSSALDKHSCIVLLNQIYFVGLRLEPLYTQLFTYLELY